MKILFISKLDVASADLFEHMLKEHEAQLCPFVSDVIRRMIKITDPDVIFVTHDISFGGSAYSKLLEDAGSIPVMVLCDKDDEILADYNITNVKWLIRPLSATRIISLIENYIAEVDQIEFEETAEIIEEVVIEEEPEDDTPKRILAVDDNGQVLRTIVNLLKDKYEVSVAPSVEVALSQLVNQKVDLILLDYDMPETDGYTALKLIKMDPKLQNIPVLFLTGVTDKQRIVKVFEYKPEGYLLKPIDSEKLKQKIYKLIG